MTIQIGTVITDGATTQYRYHHTDHLGGTHVETDGAGTMLEYMVYEPYGKVRYNHQAGSYTNDHKYTGKEQDSETGFQYFEARYYDNVRGQFMSQDPLYLSLGTGDLSGLRDPHMWNSYAYARSNPYAYVDPDGMAFRGFGNFISGIANAWGSNNMFGFGRGNSNNSAYNFGQSVGDSLSMVQGIAETAAGAVAIGGGTVGGIITSPTGVGAIGGVAVSAGGIAAIGHGSAVGMMGANNLTDSIFTRNNSGGGSNASQTSIAGKIANGHAYRKHVIRRGEFPGIRTKEEFQIHIQGVIDSPTDIRTLKRGRTGYWRESDGTVVIHDPRRGDRGTAFRPQKGAKYFYEDLE